MKSKRYYETRAIVRFVFWSAFTIGMIYWAGHIGGGKVL